MKIELGNAIAQGIQNDYELGEIESTQSLKSNNLEATSTQVAIDKATGLMQSIVSDKSTNEVLKKMPPDEYLHLVSLLDDIINESIDKFV